MNQVKDNSQKNELGQREPNPVKAYEPPVLVHYGDVRDVTLGPTVGIGESGAELGRRNPP